MIGFTFMFLGILNIIYAGKLLNDELMNLSFETIYKINFLIISGIGFFMMGGALFYV